MTAWRLAFDPAFRPAWLYVLGALALAATLPGLVARRRGGAWRALAAAALLAALAGPSLVGEKARPSKTVVAVVVDRSGSQAIGGRAAQTTAAVAALRKALTAMPDVEARFVDAGPTPDEDANGTRLFAALRGALADVPPARVGAAILVTDGVVHDVPADASTLGFPAPVHALVTGAPSERDRRIELVEAPRYGIVGKEQVIAFKVFDSGGDAPVDVTVRRDGAPDETIRAAVGARTEVRARIDHAGPNVFEFSAAPAPGELTLRNNRVVATVEGVRDKLHVLLVSGAPHPGERMWRNILKSDPNVDLVHFTILRPPERPSDVPIDELSLIAFPVPQLFGPDIGKFDLIVFDRYARDSVLSEDYLANIARYVRDGGALLVAAGPEFAGGRTIFDGPLGDVTPVKPEAVVDGAFRAEVTRLGRRHPVTAGLATAASKSSKPWGRWFRVVASSPLGGTSLIETPSHESLLTLNRVGKGRVGVLLSDQMWLWARGYDGGGPYLALLRRLAHWLMKEPDLEEEALRATATGKTVTVERRTLADKAGPVTLEGPSGEKLTVNLSEASPGLWTGKAGVPATGLWRARDGALSALVNVGAANSLEFRDVVSTTKRLAPLAEATGGAAIRIGNAAGGVDMPRLVSMGSGSGRFAGAGYIGIRRTDARVVEGVRTVPLALGWAGLLVLLGAILAAWLWESRVALPRPRPLDA
ncbi:MAG: hypothetical protein KGI57_09650 [Hyphomicrobiales bacterium]|nr:hypothetical protein [Hyphomicrobiales bacterium]MDE2017958.1 hypothetical protein [Hyphomicrobiales bacterium]